jgi:competence protein ComEC
MQSLIADPPPGPVTLFKLPHHGSRHSVPAPLIELLQPQIAFVSAGYQNHFGFPHPSIVADLENKKIPLFQTDQDGTFRFSTNEERWEVEKLPSGFFIDTSVATLLHNSGFFTPQRSRLE